MPSALRVGILGAGPAGLAHAVAFGQLPDVAVTSIWSRTRARAEATVRTLGRPGIYIYDRWVEMIAQRDIDVLSIATPPIFRRAPLTAALERGLHVLVEKEFTGNLDDVREIVAFAERAGTVTAVSLSWRYAPAPR